MRKLVVLAFMSLDGVMQAPGGPEEDVSGGFSHGGWSVGYWDDFMGNVMVEQMSKPFDLVLGRRTYEIFAAHWPNVRGDDPFAARINNARKHVASNTLSRVDWKNSTLLKGDISEEVRKLKAQDGPELQVHGSANLIQTLLKHDLVDEFRLKIYPIVLGKGKHLFADGAIPAGLRLVDSKTSSTGVIIATYKREGEIKTGTFALENPTADPKAEELARVYNQMGGKIGNERLLTKCFHLFLFLMASFFPTLALMSLLMSVTGSGLSSGK